MMYAFQNGAPSISRIILVNRAPQP
jgi:hypothetical protein